MKRKKRILLYLLPILLLFTGKYVHAEDDVMYVESRTRYMEYDKTQNKPYLVHLYVLDGKEAFCIERSKTTPIPGMAMKDLTPVKNEALRKVLYYGYHGPGDKGYGVWKTGLAACEANGDNNVPTGKTVLAEIQKLASPPDTFRVWKVSNEDEEYQDLAFYTIIELTFDLRLQKVDDAGTALEGAEFTVYSDAACTKVAAKGTTDKKGKVTFQNLETVTTYYVKETKAPEGCQISEEIYEIFSDGSDEQLVIEKTIVNQRNYDLPETGSSSMLFLQVTGTVCLVLSTKQKRRRFIYER